LTVAFVELDGAVSFESYLRQSWDREKCTQLGDDGLGFDAFDLVLWEDDFSIGRFLLLGEHFVLVEDQRVDLVGSGSWQWLIWNSSFAAG
jgi:hypothetical protein